MKKLIVVVFVAGVLIWTRCNFDGDVNICRYIAIINCIAMACVLLDIMLEVYKTIISDVNNNPRVYPRKIKGIRHRLVAVLLLIFLVLVTIGILYICRWYSGKWNDIISIAALAISLVVNDVIDMMKNVGKDHL